ncbi:aminopeptidase N-like [Chironomus tepperi]|uniref:aminopeptidase N-like n=1 Tax=Chironomus tepperi TaxID=113505 RepID=UPI00391F7198
MFLKTFTVFIELSVLYFTLASCGSPYRLPNNSYPLNYGLSLRVSVEDKSSYFTGRVKIHIKIKESSDSVTLHAKDLSIRSIILTDLTSMTKYVRVSYKIVDIGDLLIINLPYSMSPDSEIHLDINYHGYMTEASDDVTVNRGIVIASFTDIDNSTQNYIYTDFEATRARECLPCYDEPGIRAPFSLQIEHHSSYNAISNMPVIRRFKLKPSSNYVVTAFDETPKMQSYLLAFTVSQFDYIQSNDLDIPQKMYARQLRIVNGDVNKIVVYLDKGLKTFQEYFKVPFSLPKLDHFIGPDFYTAIENWGVIGYSERFLLDNSMFSNIRTLLHEYAHQYFGNLVSPKWWSYLWLSEGFAKYYDTELLKIVMPEEMNKIERHMQTTRFYAYIVDYEASTNPLNHYVEEIEDINKKFDNIAYHKAACIIQMFQGVVGVETWKKGIKYFLEDNQYTAVEPNDLHKAVQKSLDEDFPGNSLNIDHLMSSWEDRAGFPKISVSLVNGILKLSQKRDVDGDDLQGIVYNIPITYSTSKNPNFDDFSTKLWMTGRELEIKDFTDNWIVFNNQQTGYYKIDYDENLWNRIIDQLHANYSVIHHINREWLFNFRLYKLTAGDHDKSTTLRLLTYLKQEDNLNVLHATQNLIRKFLDANENDETVKSELKDILEVVYQKTKDQENVNTIRYIAHHLGVQVALDEMMNILGHPHKNANAIFCSGLKYANETMIDTVMNVLRQLNDTELVGPIVHGLGCVEDLEMFKKVISVPFEKGIKNLKAYYISWMQLMDTAEKADIFLTFMEQNYDRLYEKSPDVMEYILKNFAFFMKAEGLTDRVMSLKRKLKIE